MLVTIEMLVLRHDPSSLPLNHCLDSLPKFIETNLKKWLHFSLQTNHLKPQTFSTWNKAYEPLSMNIILQGWQKNLTGV